MRREAPQDEAQVSYISKLMREDGELDWSQSADALERRIRAYDPWPGTATNFTDKKGRVRRLKIFPQVTVTEGSADAKPGQILSLEDSIIVACGEGALEITHLQPDGSRRMTAVDFLRSAPFVVGDFLQAK